MYSALRLHLVLYIIHGNVVCSCVDVDVTCVDRFRIIRAVDIIIVVFVLLLYGHVMCLFALASASSFKSVIPWHTKVIIIIYHMVETLVKLGTNNLFIK